MKVCSYLAIKPVQELPGVTKREVITAKDGAPNFCMRIFEVEPGSSSPSHSHPWEHEIFVLAGEGVVVGEKGETEIARDTVIFIPPGEHHCLVNKGSGLLRFVCLIPLAA